LTREARALTREAITKTIKLQFILILYNKQSFKI